MTGSTPRPQVRTLGDYVIWQQGREPGMTTPREMPRPPSGIMAGAFETSAGIPTFSMKELKASAARNRANSSEGRRERSRFFLDAQSYVQEYFVGRMPAEIVARGMNSPIIEWAVDAVADSAQSWIGNLWWTSDVKWRNVELQGVRLFGGDSRINDALLGRMMKGAKLMGIPSFLDVVVQQLGGNGGAGTGETKRTVSEEVVRAELSRF